MHPPPRIHHGPQVNAIESLRGIAALMVLIYHLAELVKLPLPETLGFIPKYFGLGVPLFYTLSGFVLAFGYADRLYSRSQLLSFYSRRLFRIMPLFYSLLAIWLFLSWLVWNKTFSVEIIFLNLSFLFGLVPGQHESIVWAGWSIGIEMLFYLVFPIVALLVHDYRTALLGFVVSCILSNATYTALMDAGLKSYAYMNLVNHLPYFLAGMAVYRIWQRLGFKRHAAGWILLCAALTLALLFPTDRAHALLGMVFSPLTLRFGWAIIFGMLILSACLAANPLLERGPLRHLGQISFSMYLLHPLLMVALIKAGLVPWVTAITPNTGTAFALGLFITTFLVWAASSLSFRFIEYPGINLGRRVSARFTGKTSTV